MPEDVLELTDELAEPIEGEQPEGETTEPAEGEQQEEVTSLLADDGKKLAKPILDQLSKIKQENPSVGKLLFKTVQENAQLRREFPGGLSEVRELRSQIEEYGGPEEIRKSVENAAEFSNLGKAFLEADPAFVEDLVASDAEAFSRVAPMVFDRFAKEDPDAWRGYIGRQVSSYLEGESIPLMMLRLADLIQDRPQAVELFNYVNDRLATFKTLAAKQPIAKAAPVKRAETDDRENQLRAREYGLERNQIEKTVTQQSMEKALAGRTVNTQDRAAIQELYQVRLKTLANNHFKGWQDKLSGYMSRNDKQGYLRYVQSMANRTMPEAMASAVNTILKGRTATPAAKKPVVNGTAAKPAEGFTLVAKEPDTWLLDWDRTDQAMLKKNQAVLKDGKKVTWR